MHYVCPQCGGVSETAKSCDTEGCSGNGQALVACNCEDGQHSEVKAA